MMWNNDDGDIGDLYSEMLVYGNLETKSFNKNDNKLTKLLNKKMFSRWFKELLELFRV